MKQLLTKVLHETNIKIKGNEPFLSYNRAGLVTSLVDYSGQRHTLSEQYGGSISLSEVKKGDNVYLCLIHSRDIEVPWYEPIKKLWGRISK